MSEFGFSNGFARQIVRAILWFAIGVVLTLIVLQLT